MVPGAKMLHRETVPPGKIWMHSNKLSDNRPVRTHWHRLLVLQHQHLTTWKFWVRKRVLLQSKQTPAKHNHLCQQESMLALHIGCTKLCAITFQALQQRVQPKLPECRQAATS